MDAARQLIRYGIPGAVLLMTLAMTYVLLRLSLNLPPTSKDVPLREAIGPIGNNVSPAAGIALAIPVGFLCYQLYHWTYRALRPFGFVSANRGGEILARLTERQRTQLAASLPTELALPPELLARLRQVAELDAVVKDPFAWPRVHRNNRNRLLRRTGWLELAPPDDAAKRETRRIVSELYEERWNRHHAVSAVLLDTTALAERTTELKRQWTSLSDTYHALGVTRTALAFGVAIGGLSNLLQALLGRTGLGWTDFMDSTLAAGVVILATIWFIGVINHARFRAYHGSTTRLGHGLRAALNAHPELLDHLAIERTAAATTASDPGVAPLSYP